MLVFNTGSKYFQYRTGLKNTLTNVTTVNPQVANVEISVDSSVPEIIRRHSACLKE